MKETIISDLSVEGERHKQHMEDRERERGKDRERQGEKEREREIRARG